MTATSSAPGLVGFAVRRADFADPRLEAFLGEHLADMAATSPPESVHALDLAGLDRPSVRLWTAYDGDALIATGGIAVVHGPGGEPQAGHEELKSMRTHAGYRGRGLARAMVRLLVGDAAARGVRRISLETGTEDYFAAARGLYASEGFAPCEPFGTYVEDENSVFMTRWL
ncbi:GNAT family N-acetyltransferase [Zhihengliuella sp.]|uniref:GNAT family N-acetyltransferase n=1 Tax=Zhihengliuella sp. TaxID=1954483 RepID=UPI002811957F|nr:GNAT family N-acetyltransferase [Zhihengliuella sp.]